MSRAKAFAVASCLGLLAVAFVPARADQWNKKTILTVNEPVALPNTVLQPGKYVLKLMDSQSNRHIVQVFTEGEQKLITTILAVPDYQVQAANDTQFSFWETSAGQPRALRSWFYPGDNFGQEFAYPKDMAMKIAKSTNQNVPAIMTDNTEDVSKAEVRTMTPSGETQELAQNNQAGQPSTATDTTTTHSSATTTTPPAPSTDQSASSSMNDQKSASSTDTTAQSSTAQSSTANPSEGQNVHAMPENNQTAQSTDKSNSQRATTSSTDTTTSSQSANTSATGTNPTDNSAGASAQAATGNASASATTGTGNSGSQAGVSADTHGSSMASNRSELPRTASPLPLTGLAGLGAAAAAVAARVASRKR